MSQKTKVSLTYLSVFLVFLVVITLVMISAKPNDPNGDKQRYVQPQSEYVGHDITLQEAQQMERNFVAYKKTKNLKIHGYGIRFPAKEIQAVANQRGAEYVDIRFFASSEGQFTTGITASDILERALPEKKEMGSCCEDVISLMEVEQAPVAKTDTLLKDNTLIGKK
jgi:hypothetical protein